MIKTKLFIIFCWFQNLAHSNKAMVSDGKGFDRLFKCLFNNNDAIIKDVSEHCAAEKGRNGYCLCNFTEKESKESIFKDCVSSKKTFCSGYKIINQPGHCNKTLCMDALLKYKDSENSDTTTYFDQTTNDENRDREEMEEYLCQENKLNITCPNNFVISFDDANFGRGQSDRQRCKQFWGIESTHCDNHEQTLKVLNNKCHEQQKCFLPVEKNIFGNPCTGVTKYLYVKYHCKRKVNHDSENAEISSNIDHTTYDGKENDKRDDRKGRRDRKDRKDDRKKHSRNSHITTYSDHTALNGNENKNDRWNRKKNRWDRKDDRKEQSFKVGAIVGISVGITGTLILVLVILAIIYECKRRSKKKKRKQLARLQSIDQRFEMAHLESGTSGTNNEEYNIPSTNKSLNADEAQGEYFVLDPSITKYDKDLSNRKLPEITRFSGAEGDENVYYEIDEDKIESSTDMEGVHQKKIEEVRDQGFHNRDLAINQTQLGSKKKNTEQLIRPQSVDQRTEMANLESSHSSTDKGGNTILSANKFLKRDEAQGEYFVLDPCVTKYDKDLVLPEVKRISVAQDDEKVYNGIDEDKIESSTNMKLDHQKQMEETRDIAVYHTDLTNNQNQ